MNPKLLFIVFLFLCKSSLSQTCCPYIVQTGVSPASPVDGDSVYFFYHVASPSAGSSLGCQLNRQGNQFELNCCFYAGLLPVIQDYTDTVYLGQLQTGQYVLNFRASVSLTDSACIEDQSNSDTVSFMVSNSTGFVTIPLIRNQQKTICSSILPPDYSDASKFMLMDIRGCVLSVSCDSDALPNALYFLLPRSPGSTQAVRWLKIP